MFNPCIEHCYKRYGKQYSSDCDDKCEYVKTVKDKKFLEERNNNRKIVLNEIKTFLIASTKNQNKKRGVLYILKIEELRHLVELIKKLAN